MTIQWFPGHMAKARREVTEKLKLVDIIFELVDARIPVSSANPMLDEIIHQKPRLKLLNKADMADKEITKEWISHFSSEGQKALAINSQEGIGLQQIVKAAEEVLKPKFDRLKAKGVKPRAIRAMIIGIPNVGKSTLINRLAKKNIAKTGNTPGITRSQQWIKVGKELELLDTPGILWPKFDDQEIGYKLALTGAIKDTILNLHDISIYGLKFLEKHYPGRLMERYNVGEIPEDIVEIFDIIGELRGSLRAKGEVNYDKVAELVVRDIRSLKLGPLSFDIPGEEEIPPEE
ncbi:ribosome biogenesis GTPase YlqF [Heyndrickxia acidicola]|uniref:Ribosome biogenesis GTPase A n=1 Tax=Heyndrickxia acidicola TaxID=209389 RepID=A0ABU6MEI4_9BACI|nr:ribosome biogenesis GTPase YlqF [Heyndrickxia acidicola]MED1202093.1 ribosome biogenesis GTPase YlqF [Heyndrickxia acidicola]